MRLLYLASSLAALMTMFTEAHACSGTPFKTLHGQTVDTYVTVRSGAVCGVRISNSAGGVHRIEIIQQPRSGRAGARDGVVRYQSAPGFTGADFFAYRQYGTQALNGAPSVSTVQINVTVTP